MVAACGLTLLSGCDSGQQQSSSSPSRDEQPPEVASQPDAEASPAVERNRNVSEPTRKASLDLSYLDEDTELVLFARPAGIADSPIVQTLTGGNLGSLEELPEKIGLRLEQIGSVVVGVKGLRELSDGAGGPTLSVPFGMPGSMPGSQVLPDEAASQAVIVVRTRSPVNLNAMMRTLTQEGRSLEMSHKSKSFYGLVPPPPPGAAEMPSLEELKEITGGSTEALTELVSICLYAADQTTLVFADEPSIERIIEQGKPERPSQLDLSFIPEAKDLVVAFRTETFSAIPSQQASLGSPDSEASTPAESSDDADGDSDSSNTDALQELQPHLQAHADTVALLFDLESDVKLEVLAQCDAAASAAKAGALVGQGIQSARQSFEQSRASLPDVIQQVGEALLETLDWNVDKQLLSVSVTLPQSQYANLPALPAAAMGMMMKAAESSESVAAVMGQNSLTEANPKASAQEVIDHGQASVGDEFPSGIELHGLARWRDTAQDGASSDAPVEVAIVASGELARQSRAYGHLMLTEAAVAEGYRLKWLGVTNAPLSGDPLHDLVPIDRNDMFSPHPQEGVAVTYGFSFVGRPATKLQVIAGEFTLVVPTNVRKVTLARLPGPEQSMDDPVLRAAELTVHTETERERQSAGAGGQEPGRGGTVGMPSPEEMAELTGQLGRRGAREERNRGGRRQGGNRSNSDTVTYKYNRSPSIGAIELLSAEGTPLVIKNWMRTSDGDRVTKTVTLPDGVDPSELGLRVTVYDDAQEIRVPFRFEDLSLPEPPSDSPLDGSMLCWTPSDFMDQLPDELLVDALVRWPREGQGLLASSSAGPGQRRRDSQTRGGGGGNAGSDVFVPTTREELIAAGILDPGAEFDPGGAGPRSQPGGSNSGRPGSERSDPEKTVEVAIDLTGPLTTSIIAVGEPSIETVVSEHGDELTYGGSQFDGTALDGGWIPWDRQAISSSDQPPDGLRILCSVDLPALPVERIEQFRGTAKVRTVRDRREVVVPNLNARTDRRIHDRHLQRYDIQFAVAISGNVLRCRLLQGDVDRIAEIFPADSEGDRIANVSHSTTPAGEYPIHMYQFPGRVPANVAMKFVLNIGLQEIDVPLRFSNLPIPPRPDDEGSASDANSVGVE